MTVPLGGFSAVYERLSTTREIDFRLGEDVELIVDFFGVDADFASAVDGAAYWGLFDTGGVVPAPLGRMLPTNVTRLGTVDTPIRTRRTIFRGLIGHFVAPSATVIADSFYRIEGTLRRIPEGVLVPLPTLVERAGAGLSRFLRGLSQ